MFVSLTWGGYQTQCYHGYRYEYLWADTDKYKKPTALSAPQYMSILMEWIENIINNEDVFVVQAGE